MASLRRTWGISTILDFVRPFRLTRNRSEAAAELKSRKLDFLPFPKLEEAVKEDVRYLNETKLVPDSVVISGWVYEVETGKTVRVV
jgi:carbonic anhydrase